MDFDYLCAPMKAKWLIMFLLFLGCSCSRNDALHELFSEQDAEYEHLVDSLSSVFDYEIELAPIDSVLLEMQSYYASGNTLRHLWMQAQSEYFIGLGKWRNGNDNEAVVGFLKALRILDAHFNEANPEVSLLYSKIHFRVSWIMYGYGQYPLSKKIGRYSFGYAERSNDTSQLIRTCSHLISTYERLGKNAEDLDTARFYAKKGLAFANAQRFPNETASLYAEFGNVYRRASNFDTAIILFRKAMEIAPEKSGIYYETINYLAFVYYYEHEYDTAIACLKEGLNSKMAGTRCVSAYGLADCYMQIGDTASAAPYLAIANEDQTQNYLDRRLKSGFVADYEAYLQQRNGRKPASAKGKWLFAGLSVVLLAVSIFVLRRRKTQRPAETDLGSKSDTGEQYLQSKARFAETAIYATIIGRCSRKLSPDDLQWRQMRLSATEWDELLQAVDQCFPKFRSILRDAYGMNSQAEMEYCLLSLFEISDANKAGLMSLSYQGIRSRRNRVVETLKCDSKSFSAVIDDILRQSVDE